MKHSAAGSNCPKSRFSPAFLFSLLQGGFKAAPKKADAAVRIAQNQFQTGRSASPKSQCCVPRPAGLSLRHPLLLRSLTYKICVTPEKYLWYYENSTSDEAILDEFPAQWYVFGKVEHELVDCEYNKSRAMTFHCRQDELRKMNLRYHKGSWECIVIYGRRRVGKTALINEFCKDKNTVYFSALNASARENLWALSKAIYQNRHPDDENYPVYSSIEAALSEIGKMAAKERLVFVIDDYPYLAKALPSVSSRIQHLIDHSWQESKLYLILCGSSMSFMQNQVLGYESPLYGRRTAQFKIEPLTYKETAEFHPELSHEENAWVYGITGGIPHYINKLGIQSSFDEAILDSVFDRSGYLFEEPDNLLKQELREPGVYNSIITELAEGASKLNEIATGVGMESGVCMKYIKTLMELGILRKETPVTEKPGKKTIYSVEDNFFRFWYRFVPRNYSLISSGRFPQSYERVVKAKMHDFMGLIFEKMCKEYLLRYAEDLPFDILEIGQWWGTDQTQKKQIQIDIVAVPVTEAEQKVTEYLIGSCKFRNEKIGMDEFERIRHYATVFAKEARHHFFIFSLGGFTDELMRAAAERNVRLVTLDDMYL